MSTVDPKLSDEHWGELPFPREEMALAKIDLFVEGIQRPYLAQMLVQHNPSNGLFATTVLISDLKKNGLHSFDQKSIRLPKADQSAICRNEQHDRRHTFKLFLPSSVFWPEQPPIQLS